MPEMFRIKAVTRDLITGCGGFERAGEIAGYSTSTMHRYASASHSDVIPLQALLLLERDFGQPVLTELLCKLQADALGETPTAGFTLAYVDMNHRLAELQAEVALALSDGKITPREKAAIEERAASVATSLDRLRDSNAKGADA